MNETYDLDIMRYQEGIVLTPDQIMEMLGKAWTDLLFLLYVIFIIYFIASQYKSRIPENKLWAYEILKGITWIAVLYYPVSYYVYYPW